MSLPELVHTALKNWFRFPNAEIYCQVATVFHDQPHLRTMLLYEVSKEGRLIFLTGTDTQKWRDLQDHTKVAICFFNGEYGQIICEGKASLKTGKKDPTEAQRCWNLLSPSWKSVYRADSNDESLPASFGAISIIPERWEVLQLNKETYLKSIRKELVWDGTTWILEELRPA